MTFAELRDLLSTLPPEVLALPAKARVYLPYGSNIVEGSINEDVPGVDWPVLEVTHVKEVQS